jgi:hypothetical protein
VLTGQSINLAKLNITPALTALSKVAAYTNLGVKISIAITAKLLIRLKLISINTNNLPQTYKVHLNKI